MKTFVRVSEVWVPSADRTALELGDGSYGGLDSFRAASRTMRFPRGEGLPGRAWERGKPVVLEALDRETLSRSDSAMAAGLSTAIAVPFFVEEELTSVVVFFCGSDPELVGAIEIWEEGDENELHLTAGFYGAASSFEWVSRSATFRVGHGLPGSVFASGLPHILPDLGRTSHFLRADAALRIGIEHGLGIPCGRDSAPAVVTMLSGTDTPIAQRVEIWIPTPTKDAATYADGYCDLEPDLSLIAPKPIPSGEGAIGRAMKTQMATISNDLEREPGHAMRRAFRVGLRSVLAIPVFVDGELSAVVAMYTGAQA